MTAKGTTKPAVAFDLLCGFIAFMAVRVVPHLTGIRQDIRLLIVTTFVAFSVAAFYRVRSVPGSVLFSAMLVAFGGVVPALAMNRLGISLTAVPFFISFLVFSIVGSFLGASVRWLTLHERRAVALLLMGTSLILVGIAAVKLVPAWSENRAYSLVEKPITPFAFETLGGQKISSNGLKGHVVVLSFWATWCGPCQAELPEIAAVARHYASNPKVLVFAVDSGTEGDTLDKAKTYLTRRGLTLTGAIDSVDGESPGAAARSLGLSNLPVLYVLDQSGKLRVTHSGYDSSEDLQRSLSRQIDSLL